METAEHRESYESRGSRTDLGAPGGESPLGDSTTGSILYRAEIGSSGWIADLPQPRGEQAPISDLPSRLHPRGYKLRQKFRITASIPPPVMCAGVVSLAHLDRLHHALVFVFDYVAMKYKASYDLWIGKWNDHLAEPGLPSFMGGTLKVSRKPSNCVERH